MNNGEEDKKPTVRTPKAATPQKDIQPEGKISNIQLTTLKGLLTPEREPKLLEYFKVSKLEELTTQDFAKALSILQK